MQLWLVDDDWHVAERVGEALLGLDWTMRVFRQAVEVYQCLEDGAAPPDVLLVDEDLHGEPSWRFVEELRQQFSQDCLIFSLCSEFNANFRQITRSVGVDGWLDKPIDPDLLGKLCKQAEDGLDLATSDRGSVNFDLKMGRLSMSWVDGMLCIWGTLNQYADLHRIADIVPNKYQEVVIDCSGIQRINVEGARQWNELGSSEFGQGRKFILRRCPMVLLEFYRLMPRLFGDNVNVESLFVQLSSHTQSEFERYLVEEAHSYDEPTYVHMLQRMLSSRWYALADSSKQVYLQAAREIPYASNLDMLMEVESEGNESNEVVEYLPFAITTLRYAISEFMVTRDTIMDQVSRLSARINSFHSGVTNLGGRIFWEPPARDQIMKNVVSRYQPILSRLIGAERLLTVLNLKHSPSAVHSRRRATLRHLLGQIDLPCFEPVLASVLQSELLHLERRYDIRPTDENYLELCKSIYGCMQRLLAGLGEGINEIGVEVYDMIRGLAAVDEDVRLSCESIEGKTFTDEQLLTFKTRTLMSWEPVRETGPLLQQAKDNVLGYTLEVDRIMQALYTHDMVSQVLEHRGSEMCLIETGVGRAPLVDMICNHAVTMLEKQLVAYWYPETEQRFEDYMQTADMVLF